MSEYSTSSAVRSLTRWYLMRSVVSFSNWWNTGRWVSVAEYSSTGTDTSPNVSTPDQIARAISLLRLLLAELPGELVAAHLGAPRQVALLGDLVEFRLGLRGVTTGPLAPGHGGALLTQR